MAYNSGYWEELEGSLRKQLAEARAEIESQLAEREYLVTKIEKLETHVSRISADLAFYQGPAELYNIRAVQHYQEENARLETELAEALADLRLAKNIIETHVERVAERDKLIEQMRDTLKALKQRHYVNDDDNWYSCPASGLCSNDHAGTDCNCGADHANSIIQAALRAAERGE